MIARGYIPSYPNLITPNSRTRIPLDHGGDRVVRARARSVRTVRLGQRYGQRHPPENFPANSMSATRQQLPGAEPTSNNEPSLAKPRHRVAFVIGLMILSVVVLLTVYLTWLSTRPVISTEEAKNAKARRALSQLQYLAHAPPAPQVPLVGPTDFTWPWP